MFFKRLNEKSQLTIVFMFLLCYFGCSTDVLNGSDSDGDGLSDFQEIHKYLTNPVKKDTDSDGIPDGDWAERREYTYSVRSILQFMPPFDKAVLNDDFQDARILQKRNDYIELEVIHYPFSTASKSIKSNPNWQSDYAKMKLYLSPGITTNWDTKMRTKLLNELKADGIVIEQLTDKQLVLQVSSWLLEKSEYLDKMFTTYYIWSSDGQLSIYPGLEEAFERGKNKSDWTIQQQFEHELLGREMFYNKTHGSCTSFSIYLTTVLRAIGIPTRMIIAIPAVDPSNDEQLRLVQERITHNQVRKTMLRGLKKVGRKFTAHTFNEVYIGNQWHRLDYNKLGQNILGQKQYGLITHLYTFNDLIDANLAPTWGYFYGRGKKNIIFKHSNPYSVITLSDLFGAHSNMPNPVIQANEHKHLNLTISKVYWFHSEDKPTWISDEAVPKDDSGHLLFHVDDWFEDEGIDQYISFYKEVDKHFVLKAQGHPNIHAQAKQGYWRQEFYICISKEDYEKMAVGIPYTVHPINSHLKYKWKISPGLTICKPSN